MNIQKLIKKHFVFFSLLLILLAGLIISLNQISQPMIAEGDAYSRVNISLVQKRFGISFDKSGGMWLPIHFSMMTFLLSIFYYPSITPRILTIVFSLASILAIYFYTKSFSKNKHTSLLASLLFLLFPLRIYLGTQTLSEPIFIFFLLLSLTLITNDKLSYKRIFLSLFFLNIASGIRYESWTLLPLIWFFIITKPINLSKKVSFILLSTVFPLYWMHLSQTHTGNFLSFFNQKYRTAQNHKMPRYFNLSLSLSSWKEKLIPIFPFSFLFLCFLNFKNLLNRFTSKNIFYYSVPIFFYLSLVAQVYLGTMEWNPTRYLLIPTTFLIPLLASAIYEIINFIYLLFKEQNSINRTHFLFFILIFTLIVKKDYLRSLNYTRLEITDRSLLQIPSHGSDETIKNSLMYLNFLNLIEQCEKLCGNEIIFFYEERNRTYLDQGLFYFLNKPGTDLNKKYINRKFKENVVVWEKSSHDEKRLIRNFKTIYENEKFSILKRR